MNFPTTNQLDLAQQVNKWSFGNEILYNLCRDNFKHEKDEHILTKVLFIGRIYAAAVERRKSKDDEINDDFYTKIIIPKFQKSTLDLQLSNLKKFEDVSISTDNITTILKLHHYLTEQLWAITNLNKRSFSSKYLHFHLPELFYIYDSRAASALRQFTNQIPSDLTSILKMKDVDKEYATFFCKCHDLKRQIYNQFSIKLTNRQLDNLLIEVANKKNSK